MSIHFITGKPGNGKGLVGMQVIIDELVQGDRCIITNLPVRVEPWVRVYKKGGDKKYQAEIGLRNYLLKKWGRDFDVGKRVHVLPDDRVPEFFRYRAVGGVLEQAAVELGEKGTVIGFDTSLALRNGGVVYLVDEAWKFFSAREWQLTGKGILYYAAQHRHLGDDFYIVTQHTKQVDTAFRQVAQDFWVVTNHSKRSLGPFRQPDIFTKAIYGEPPLGKQDSPMSRKVFKLDKKGVGACYDTAAGVGIAGVGGADIGAKKKGLPWYYILALMAVVAVCIIALANGAGRYAGWLLGGQNKGSAAAKGAMQVSPAIQKKIEAERKRLAELESAAAELAALKGAARPVVWVTGLYRVGGKTRVFLSDGSEVKEETGRIERVYSEGVDIDGRFIPWAGKAVGEKRVVAERVRNGSYLVYF